ncbi:MAG: ornithine cyclodeaminase family protein, partial [Caulobacterales bacterium]|nr:ornithine cyclodeaminase family protein [Caulobacterales bacterium]
MIIITEREVERHLSTRECVEAMRAAMIAVSSGETHLPIRQFMPIDGAPGKMAMMPGVLGAPWCFGVKLVCKYERAPDSPYGTHVGVVLVFDAEQGAPLAMIEGSSLTAIRTAAASALATDLLARADAHRLLVLGCGEQARRHVHAMRAVREVREVAVWGRRKARAEAFADEVGAAEGLAITVAGDLAEAAGRADLICTTTSAPAPILQGAWLSRGAHVNLVGSAVATTAEA